MSYDRRKHHRRSVRLRAFDYSRPGGYFVTLCAHRRRALFGRIADDKVVLNARGEIVRACWQEIPQHFPHVELDAFVVMPNHLHGVIMIWEGKDQPASDDVGAQHAVPLHPKNRLPQRMFGKLAARSLPAIIRSYKSAVTRRMRAREHGRPVRVWQRNYYEHVIRNNDDLSNIRQYILDNPAKWATDSENPEAVSAGN